MFLTLPKELQLLCVEKLSLHHVRDAMGSSLEPVVGLLRYAIRMVDSLLPDQRFRVLTRVLALADPEYAARLETYACTDASRPLYH